MKKPIKLTEELNKFLKEEGVWMKFLTNADDLGDEVIENIAMAFLWDESEEGVDFWGKLSNKFNQQTES